MHQFRRRWKIPFSVVALAIALALALACGGGGGGGGGGESGDTPPPPGAGSARPSGAGACALLTQGEIDAIFGAPVGAGVDEDLGGGIELCSWPAGDEPSFLLQVGPAEDDVETAVTLGEGYRVERLEGWSGPAALAVVAPQEDEPAGVAVVALTVAARTLVVSPIGLDVAEGSPAFERVRAMLEAAAARMTRRGGDPTPTES